MGGLISHNTPLAASPKPPLGGLEPLSPLSALMSLIWRTCTVRAFGLRPSRPKARSVPSSRVDDAENRDGAEKIQEILRTRVL